MGFDRYFDDRAGRFSRFYRSEPVTRALGRGALFDRLRFAVATAEALGATHVLDVGCGSGPLFEPLAQRGIRVTGLEPAASMLELARLAAARYPGLVEVREGRWEEIDEGDRYDLAVALGVYDYVDEPEELTRRMASAAPSVVGSFPRPGPRTELRKVRYGVRGVSVHPYSPARIAEVAAASGLEVRELRRLGRAGHAAHLAREPTPA